MRQILPILFALLALFSFHSYAQSPASVKGTVYTTGQQPLAGATVSLSAPGQAPYTTATSAAGTYSISPVKPGTYTLKVTAVGHSPYTAAALSITTATTHNAVLTASATTLKDVAIQAEKQLITRNAEKTTINVAADATNAGNTALEVLRKAPGVAIDQDDNISLQGKSSVLITIDGKPTYLSAKELSNMLKNMQASQINTIELVTNPSAKYDANSTGGVINIKTKKLVAEGMNGTLTAGLGYNSNLSTNNSLNLNYRKNKINVFGGGGFSTYHNNQLMELTRVFTEGNSTVTSLQENRLKNKGNNYNFRGGVDYYINPNHVAGVLASGWGGSYPTPTSSVTRLTTNSTVDSLLRSVTQPEISYAHGQTFNVNYKGTLDTAGQELSFNADYSTTVGNERQTASNAFYNTANQFLRYGEQNRTAAPRSLTISALKADYTLPINKNFKVEAGAKYADVKTDNNFSFMDKVNDSYVNNTGRSNHFVYNERVAAGYVSAAFTLAGMEFQTGLRLENTSSEANSLTLNTNLKRSYTNLFPSVSVNKALNADNALSLSYSRKINRPDYEDLNPFETILDQYTRATGNPYLNPEFSHNFELGYLFKNKYSLTLSYTHTNDNISRMVMQQGALLYQTFRNINSVDLAGATLAVPVTITKWWRTNNTLMANYSRYNSADININDYHNFYTMLNHTSMFKLSPKVNATVNGVFMSPSVQQALKIGAIASMNIGVNYIVSQQLSLNASVNDVFKSAKFHASSISSDTNYELRASGDSRIAKLTATWRFGNSKVKAARQRSTASEDEVSRGSKN